MSIRCLYSEMTRLLSISLPYRNTLYTSDCLTSCEITFSDVEVCQYLQKGILKVIFLLPSPEMQSRRGKTKTKCSILRAPHKRDNSPKRGNSSLALDRQVLYPLQDPEQEKALASSSDHASGDKTPCRKAETINVKRLKSDRVLHVSWVWFVVVFFTRPLPQARRSVRVC